MTRINLLHVKVLPRAALVAEYRELPRIFTLSLKAHKRGLTPSTYGIPEEFKLGPGHMKFSSNKLNFLKDRYCQICEEMIDRGYTVNFPEPNLPGIPIEWFGDYTPTKQAIAESRKRLIDRGHIDE